MSDTEDQLKRMVMTFRVSELQMLLGYAGKNKTGRKNELQSRALDIVRLRNPSIHQKIRELYKTIQLEMMSFGDRSQSAGTTAPGGILPNQRVPSGLNTMSTGYSQSGNVGGNMGVTVNSSGYSSRSSSAQVGQVPTMSGGVGYSSIQPSHNNSYPISPDVRLKKLPFYDILGELLKPSTLGSGRYQEGTFTFSLTPQQANKIAHSRDLRPGKQDYTVQVQMRFCLLETTCEQEDNFPPNITVKINDKMCPLPSPIPTNKAGVEPKRPSRPVNVTSLCRISPTVTNRIMKLTSEDLLQRLKSKGPRLADFTRSLIKQKLREDGECEIATTSLRCSLLCPLGKMRMMLPCRAETCNHLQCFDASLFLQMNERKPTWTCPVCDKPALYDNLVIDGYFQEVLQENGECTEVTLQKDGGWIPLIQKKEQKEQQVEKRKTEVAVVETLSDDSDDSEEATKGDNDDAVIEEVRSKRKQADVEIITLSDSDDESAGPPTKRSNCQSNNSSGSVSSTNNSVDMTVNVTSNLTSNVSGTSGGSSNCGRAETASPDNSNVPASDAVIEEVRSKRKQADVEIITLSDSDDESAGPPTKRSNCQSNNSSGSVSSTNNSVDMTVNVTSNLTSNVSGTSGGSSNCGRAETASPDNSNVPASECTISNDSWRVGEVDPGKRLIFRKSLSSKYETNAFLKNLKY
ncbi:E3 SUMO-protein ligase PIAS1 [Armadillidium vulgare]|nr:E3 SUMO-protein ligase PIAS1 [Armadillidium vulgare]